MKLKVNVTIGITPELLDILNKKQLEEILLLQIPDLSVNEMKQYILKSMIGQDSERTIYISDSGNTSTIKNTYMSPIIDIIPQPTNTTQQIASEVPETNYSHIPVSEIKDGGEINNGETIVDVIMTDNYKKTLAKEKEIALEVPIITNIPLVLTEVIFNKVLERYKKGENLKQICREYNIHYITTYGKIRKHLANPKKPITFEKKELIKPITEAERNFLIEKDKTIAERKLDNIIEHEYEDNNKDDDDNMIGFTDDGNNETITEENVVISEQEYEDNPFDKTDDDVTDELPDTITKEDSEFFKEDKENEDELSDILEENEENAKQEKSHHKPNETLKEIGKRNFIPAKIMEIILEQKHQKGNKVDINELAEYTRVSVDIISKIMKL